MYTPTELKDVSLLINNLDDENLILFVEEGKKEIKNRRKQSYFKKRRKTLRELSKPNYQQSDSRILHIRNRKNKVLSHRSKYLPNLLAQDWSFLYPRESKTGNHYVYVHVDPSEKSFLTDKKSGGNYMGHPFYVGKGNKSRAYNLKRNQGHGKKIRQVLGKGWGSEDIVQIIFSGLSDSYAREIEAKLIYFFGTVYQENISGCLFNLNTEKTPDFKGIMDKVKYGRSGL